MHIITLNDKNYPELLKQIKDPPGQLYVSSLVIPSKQKASEESQPTNDQSPIISDREYPLAVVGTRKLSPYGRQATEYFVRNLAQAGMTIISGLALGIDGLAHKTTLATGGKTIAVLGSSLNNIFPAVHKKLAQDIVDSGGAIVTEYPPDTPALRAYFPQRNRIISGLSLGVLVIEAPKKSGALITAEHAFKQKRKVFVIPGRIYDKNSAGANELIQKGATLVTRPEHILQRLEMITKKIGGPTPDTPDKRDDNLTKEQTLILKHITNQSIHIDDLSKQCGLDTNKLIAHLTQMELLGLIKDTGNSHYIINVNL